MAAAQAGFVNQILATLPTSAPGVEPTAVIAAGATTLRAVFGPDQIAGVLTAYMTGLKATFAVTIAAAGLSLPISLLSRWQVLNTHAIAGA